MDPSAPPVTEAGSSGPRSLWGTVAQLAVLALAAGPAPLAPRPERLRQRVLRGRGAQHDGELARVFLQLLRPGRFRLGRQAAARAVDPGGEREALRLPAVGGAAAAGDRGCGRGGGALAPGTASP